MTTKPTFKRITVAKASYFEYPRSYSCDLRQVGPRSFRWACGSFWMAGIEMFRSADAALKFAADNGWKVQP